MTKCCVICGGDEASGEILLKTPCQQHWVCTNDVANFFERATENESLYPPKCCGQLFLIDVYEAHVPFEVSWAYRMKAQGEYSVLAKYRVYCANPSCSTFLSPTTHLKDPSFHTSYAICQNDACRKLTCTACKTLIDGVESHTCEQSDDYKEFKQTATEKGFQECPTCAAIVELAEACNHITCKCGTQFCYICGNEWKGTHGCPHYGPAVYNEEGYNQDGFHQTTGLNREGRTRREQARLDGEDDGDSEDGGDDDDDDDDGEEDTDPDELHPVLQHVEPEIRAVFAALPHDEREMFLINLQIQLFEERGVTFAGPEDDDVESEGDNEEQDESTDNSSEADNGDRNRISGQASDDKGGNGAVRSNDAKEDEHISEIARTVTNITPVPPGEATDVAMAEAVQGSEDSAGMAVTMQIDEDPTASNNPMSTPAMQNSDDATELEMSGVRYLTHLSRAPPGDAAHNTDLDGETTNVDRPVSGAELTNTDQPTRNVTHFETVSDTVTHEALIPLNARFSLNDRALLIQQTLSYLNNKNQGGNVEVSSATSLDEKQPSTPMDIDLVDTRDDEDEREAWMGPSGGYLMDEEL